MRSALIIGHQGQDGSYLWEFLARRGYRVTGLGRQTACSSDGGDIEHFDLMSRDAVRARLASWAPGEIYYLAAFHHSAEMEVPDTYDLLRKSMDTHVLGLLNVLDGIRLSAPAARLFYAASSHLFGDPLEVPQSELTPFRPDCAYGITKLAGCNLVHYYRNLHALFATVGILYNHESSRRSGKFLSRKITSTAVAIKRGAATELRIGDLSTKVDWGYAPEYVEAMWRVLQLAEPDDFVISTGHLHSVQEFVEEVFTILELDWRRFVVEDPNIIKKQARTFPLLGDSSKLREKSGWSPKSDLSTIARALVESELNNDGRH